MQNSVEIILGLVIVTPSKAKFVPKNKC